MFILGGNKRFLALQKLGYKEIPNDWIKSAEDLTEDEKKRLVVQDNIQAGDWDFEMLSEDYEQEELTEWGLEFEDYSDKNKEIDFDDLDSDMIIKLNIQKQIIKK